MESVEKPSVVSAGFKKTVEKEAANDAVRFYERVGQVVGVAIGVIVIAFFAIHQTRPTGFFTDKFGNLEAVLLYGAIVFGMLPQIARFILGQKNVARPLEAADLAFFFGAGLYLLVLFPFDFSHFAEPFPRSLEFLIDWVSGTFAKWVLGIGVFVAGIMSIYTAMLYMAVKKRLFEMATVEQKPDETASS